MIPMTKPIQPLECASTINTLEKLADESYENFIKALLVLELGITKESTLETLYTNFRQFDDMRLLNPEFEEMMHAI